MLNWGFWSWLGDGIMYMIDPYYWETPCQQGDCD
jgi:hypothetical protein